jgi:hypothetical protein
MLGDWRLEIEKMWGGAGAGETRLLVFFCTLLYFLHPDRKKGGHEKGEHGVAEFWREVQ